MYGIDKSPPNLLKPISIKAKKCEYDIGKL